MADEFKVHRLSELGLKRADRIAQIFETALREFDAVLLEGETTEQSKELAIKAAGRERALVVTKLQEASFFAKRAVAMQPRNQQG